MGPRLRGDDEESAAGSPIKMATKKKKAQEPKLNTYRAGPDDQGFFGLFGGRFVAETLMPLILELGKAYEDAKADPAYQRELDGLNTHYAGRPSPLYFAERLTKHLREVSAASGHAGGAKVYFKRDELNHTGSHKINNCLGQILLAKRMGKTRIIAETGAGQHGVAVATVCAKFELPCEIFMGAVDVERQKPQRVPHEAAGRQGQRRHVGRADAEGRHERGAARLGRQRARHLLHHRHGRGACSLSGDGARLPIHHRQGGARADDGGARAGCRTRWLPASAAAPMPSACSIPSSTTRAWRSTAWRRAATASTFPTGTAPR